jgi:hypothetical protein
MKVELRHLRNLDLERPSQPGRPAFLSAASGLLLIDGSVYVIADDENSLAIFPEDGGPGRLVPLIAGGLPLEKSERKKMKPDFEALLQIAGGILAIPSGSTANRNLGAFYRDGKVALVDFSNLYGFFGSLWPDLNIEGAAIRGTELIFFQRGNGEGAMNAMAFLDLTEVIREITTAQSLTPAAYRASLRLDLGTLEGVPLSFTDAATATDGTIWVLMAAENVASTYLDGDFTGAALGRLDQKNQMVSCQPLVCGAKPEGICFDPQSKYFYVVTDADDALKPSGLYQGTLPA